MRIRSVRATFAAAILLALLGAGASAQEVVPKDGLWLVYYAAAAPVEAFDGYSLLVLDSEVHPPIRALVDRGKTLLGYLSLGEVERGWPWFRKVRDLGLLHGENPNWKGSYFVDLRDPRWTALVIEQLIPDILRRGFHGLFFDTLDNAGYLERTDPERYKGMVEAAARLVRSIRRHYPSIPMMMNRAYEVLPAVETDIDMMLGESVYADYNFQTSQYNLVDPSLYQRQVGWLREAKARRPGLRIMTLDYWAPADTAGIRRIYDTERANGFEPYVATSKLDRIVREPPP